MRETQSCLLLYNKNVTMISDLKSTISVIKKNKFDASYISCQNNSTLFVKVIMISLSCQHAYTTGNTWYENGPISGMGEMKI